MNGAATPQRVVAWACVALVAGALIVVAIAFPAGDGDRLWQYWLGERVLHEHVIPRALGAETFAAAGAPWVPQEWLFSTLLAGSVDAGFAWLVPLGCALVAVIALVAVVARCLRRGVSALRTSAAVLLCGLATMQSFGVRAQVVGWAGVSLVLWLLEADTVIVWAIVPLTVVWANLHASVFLAPAIVMLVALAAAVRDRGWSREVRRLSAVGAASALATLATPLGIDLPRYAVQMLASPIRASIAEWGATSISTFAFTAGAAPLLLLLVAFGVRAPLRDRFVALAFALLLFSAIRNIPIFAFAVAPIALAAVPPGLRNVATPRAERIAAWVTAGTAVVAAFTVPLMLDRLAPSARDVLPRTVAAILMSRAHVAPRVFCEDFAWCGLFLTRTISATVFMDGRADPYPPAVWDEYLRVLRGNAGWAGVLDGYRVNAVLVRQDGALESLLRTQPHDWRRIGADGAARLYVRPALIAAPAWSRSSGDERVRRPRFAGIYPV